MKTKLFHLKSGGKLLFYPRKTSKGIIINLNFKAGLINDFKEKYGLAHFCEHSIFSFSTNTMTAEKRHKLFHEININGVTSTEKMKFKIVSTPNNLEKSLDFFIDGFNNLCYKQEEFDKEFKIISDEIKTRKNFNARENQMLLDSLLKDKQAECLTVSSAAGTIESIDKIKIEDLKQFHDRFLTLNNLLVIVCGNVNKKTLKNIIKKINTISSSEKNGKVIEDFEKITAPKYSYAKSVEKGKCYLTFNYKIGNVEEFKKYKLTQTALLLAQTLYKMLHEYIRDKKSISYSVSSRLTQVGNNIFLCLELPSQEENLKTLLKEFPNFISSINKKSLKEKFENCKKDKLEFYNFDVIPLYELADIIFRTYDVYNDLYGDKFIKFEEKEINEITFDDIFIMLKNALKNKPYINIISQDNPKLNYNNYCKKIKKDVISE